MLEESIQHLDSFGYCLLENAINPNITDIMAEKYYQLHQDPDNKRLFQNPNDDLYQTLFGVANLDELCWECIAHPQVIEVIQHFIGDKIRLGEACTKWVKPGAGQGGIHTDSTHDLPKILPETPWMINTIWMITDFIEENGATVVVPFSHKIRRRPTSDDLAACIPIPIVGKRGSVLLWQGGTWHGNGANTSKNQHRMALNIAYYPAWWNLMREGGHQPIYPEVFERMPESLQELVKHKVAKRREDIYEN